MKFLRLNFFYILATSYRVHIVQMWPVATNIARSVVCTLSVCLLVCWAYGWAVRKHGWTNRDAVWGLTHNVGLTGNHVLYSLYMIQISHRWKDRLSLSVNSATDGQPLPSFFSPFPPTFTPFVLSKSSTGCGSAVSFQRIWAKAAEPWRLKASVLFYCK